MRRGQVASVVVAGRIAEGDPRPCLEALTRQRTDRVEIVLVTDGRVPDDVARHADIVLESPDSLVPELWSAGIRAASGDRVGLLSVQVVPGPGWIDNLVACTGADAPAGRGGPIEGPAGGATTADWTVLFCRYSRYLLPLPAIRPDVAADNASYDRAALAEVADAWELGFWEPFVHRALRARGRAVVTEEDPLVTVANGQSLRVLVRQRFAHGRHHARLAARDTSIAGALVRVALSPLVPWVLLARCARAVLTRRRLRGRFAQCLLPLLWAHSWWAAGEARGYVDHALGRT